MIRDEIETQRIVSRLEISAEVPHALYVVADAQLLRRLIRNALDNSISFSNQRLEVRVEAANGLLQITIDDDGPGFSSESLAAFGMRRPVRIVHSEGEGRVSLGLGSVIMTAIAHRFSGTVTASNRMTARVVMTLNLPLADNPSAKAA